jgi:uncharacterized membrane protein YhaH (DUF805 family)
MNYTLINILILIIMVIVIWLTTQLKESNKIGEDNDKDK